jgi:hypothetical protein
MDCNNRATEQFVLTSAIGIDARWWEYSHTKGWVFGCKLYLTSTTATGGPVVPLTADVTTANVQDNRIYSFNIFSFFSILFTICIVHNS